MYITKLTYSQYSELQQQFDRLPDLATSYEATGEHYRLMSILKRFGYYTGDRDEAIRLAERFIELCATNILK